MRLAQYNEMVQALAPDRSDQPFGKAILPRRSRPRGGRPQTRGRLPDQTFEAAIIAAGAAQFGELCGTFGLIYRPRGRAVRPRE